MVSKARIAAVFLVTTCLTSQIAHATTLTTNSGAFSTATDGVTFTFENFDNYSVSNLSSFDFGDFTGSGPDFDVTSSSFCASGACVTSIRQTITFTFDEAINALSFGVNSGSTETFVVDGETVGNSGGAYSYFVGIYNLANPFTSVTISAAGGFPQFLFDIDNMNFGQVAPVPVPASLPLLAGGLGLAAWAATRRARKG